MTMVSPSPLRFSCDIDGDTARVSGGDPLSVEYYVDADVRWLGECSSLHGNENTMCHCRDQTHTVLLTVFF